MSGMFGFGKRPSLSFDPTGKKPVIRVSICTGEKTAGYREGQNGPFRDLMLIQNDKDLQEYLKKYGFREEDIKYEY